MEAGPAGRFEATVAVDLSIPDGYMKHYVALPEDLGRAFLDAGVERVEGTVGGAPYRRSLHVRDDGRVCLRFGMTWLRNAGLEPGAPLVVEVAEDPDPDRVDMPDELATALSRDPAVEHAWDSLTPGRQRTLVYDIERARRPDTRARRATKVVDTLRDEFGLA